LILSVEMRNLGGSVVAGLVPATSRRCCRPVSICKISVSATAFLALSDLADCAETGINEICVQGLVAGTRPATTLPPVAYISTDMVSGADSHAKKRQMTPSSGLNDKVWWSPHLVATATSQ